jgi:hypothetical protein
MYVVQEFRLYKMSRLDDGDWFVSFTASCQLHSPYGVE